MSAPPAALVAAWLALGLLDVNRVPWWAAAWLAQGHDGGLSLCGLSTLGARPANEHDGCTAAGCRPVKQIVAGTHRRASTSPTKQTVDQVVCELNAVRLACRLSG